MLRAARIKVVSVGSGGSHAINRMIAANVQGVEFISINTSAQALRASKASTRLQLGAQLTRGLGTRGNADLGRRAALEDSELIIEALDGAEMVFVVAGLGGGTGTGAAPVIASLANQMGALTVAVVTLPFGFEGRRRVKQADRGVEELLNNTGALIVIPNERLLAAGEDRFFFDSFHIADEMLCHAVQGISDILAVPSGVNRELAELRTTMAEMGQSVIGTATRSGSSRAVDAAVAAMASPLLESGAVHGAQSILINFTGSSSLKLSEVNEASNIIRNMAHRDADIVFGATLDESMGDEVKVTLIVSALRLDRNGHSKRAALNDEDREIETVRPLRLERFIGRRSVPTPVPAATIENLVQSKEDVSLSADPAAPSVRVEPPTAPASDSAPNLIEASHDEQPSTTASTTLPAEQPVVAPVEDVADEPIEQVVVAPVEQAVSGPIEQLTDAPIEEPLASPIQQLPVVPAEPVVASADPVEIDAEPPVSMAVRHQFEEPLPAIDAAEEPPQKEVPYFEDEVLDLSKFLQAPEAPPLTTPHRTRLLNAALAAYAAVSMPEEVEVESPSPQPTGFAAVLESRLWKSDDAEGDFATLEFERDPGHLVTHEEIAPEQHFNQLLEPETEDAFGLDLVEEVPSGRDSDTFQADDFAAAIPNEFFDSPVFRTTIPLSSHVPVGLKEARYELSKQARIPEPQMFDFSIGATRQEEDDPIWETVPKNRRTHANFPSFASGQPPAGSEDEFDELDIPAFLRKAN
jgi:cell division protein FtsZ